MKIHLAGIGGVGMAGLAVLLKRRGHSVTGCDVQAGARTRWLESLGIPVAIGHDPAHLAGTEALVVTPAVCADEPELIAAKARGVDFVRPRGRVLAELVSKSADSIAVCGSHGKTTTATFIAKLLLALGEKVEWAIGGETGSFPVAGYEGRGTGRPADDPPVLVVEADESDGTLAAYHAKTLVVTNCEYDHPDYFKTRDDYIACYEAARRNAGRVIEGAETNVETAVRVALARGHAAEAIAKVLPGVTAQLPDRRFERLADGVYADYGHHPTEVRYAIRSARSLAKGRVRVLFQPHRYSRTAAFKQEFAVALAFADEVVICPIYAAFEKPVEGGDSADLYAACRVAFANAVTRPRLYLARSCEEAWEHARNTMEPGDITLIQGAGDIIGLAPRIRIETSQGSAPLCKRRLWIGAGTNTWKSDLKLNVEYVKTKGPAGRPGVSLLGDPAVGPRIPWMAGIPGTIGGWVKMNAGAFGHSISEVIESVHVDGRWIPAADCGFAYRHSDISGEIQDVRFTSALRSEAEDAPAAYLSRRKNFPPGTKGSVFKNPPGDAAGRLLEAAGAKDLRVGGASVWQEHANVIVAGPDATASDFLALAQLMASRVRFRFGISLEPEVVGLCSTSASSMLPTKG